MNFWDRLRNELNYQDITHKELADKINIQKATLEAKFLRENTPDAEFLYQCSKVLNLSMDYLYTGIESNIDKQDSDILNSFRTLSPSQKKIITMLLDNFNGVSSEITSDGDNMIIVK